MPLLMCLRQEMASTAYTGRMAASKAWTGRSDNSTLQMAGVGLTPAFIQAALATVDEGHEFASSTIAAGAVSDLDGFEVVVDAASAVAERVWQGDASWSEIALRITNEEFSDEYADHLSENDDG